MKKNNTLIRIIFVSLAICSVITLHAQTKRHICYIDPPEGPVQNTSENDFDANDVATLYLNSIKEIFKPFQQPCVIKSFYQKNAKSYMHEDLYHVIDIDRSYYENKFASEAEKKAILIYVIAHEYSHCLHGDAMYAAKSSLHTLYSQELKADEEAGYVLGTLTSVDIDFIDRALPIALANRGRTESHPDIRYRIMAIKGGWIRAKTANLQDQGSIIVGQRIYKKIITKDLMYVGEITIANVWNGPAEWKYNNSKTLLFSDNKADKAYWGVNIYENKVYMGGLKDAMYDSTGFLAFSSGVWISSDTWKQDYPLLGKCHYNDDVVYEGEFEKWDRSGWGILTYSNGSGYIGQWKKDKLNGNGIEYHDNSITHKGTWIDGVFCETCK